jgi:hypothetical protein
LIDRGGVGERLGNVGVQNDDIGAPAKTLIVLAAHGTTEVVLGQYVVVSS